MDFFLSFLSLLFPILTHFRVKANIIAEIYIFIHPKT